MFLSARMPKHCGRNGCTKMKDPWSRMRDCRGRSWWTFWRKNGRVSLSVTRKESLDRIRVCCTTLLSKKNINSWLLSMRLKQNLLLHLWNKFHISFVCRPDYIVPSLTIVCVWIFSIASIYVANVLWCVRCVASKLSICFDRSKVSFFNLKCIAFSALFWTLVKTHHGL